SRQSGWVALISTYCSIIGVTRVSSADLGTTLPFASVEAGSADSWVCGSAIGRTLADGMRLFMRAAVEPTASCPGCTAVARSPDGALGSCLRQARGIHPDYRRPRLTSPASCR